MNALILGFFFLFMGSFSTLSAQQEPAFPKTNTNEKLTYKIIDAAEHTFGYDIYKAGKLLIHQPSVPGMQGNKGFHTKADAEKVAKFVLSKINNGEMPPTVTADDLKKLNINR